VRGASYLCGSGASCQEDEAGGLPPVPCSRAVACGNTRAGGLTTGLAGAGGICKRCPHFGQSPLRPASVSGATILVRHTGQSKWINYGFPPSCVKNVTGAVRQGAGAVGQAARPPPSIAKGHIGLGTGASPGRVASPPITPAATTLRDRAGADCVPAAHLVIRPLCSRLPVSPPGETSAVL
jgi:hypothetical protein